MAKALGQYSRGVSIIGIGCTPFRKMVGDPEWDGYTEGELFGYAAIEAMQDAGIGAKDLQFYYHGSALPAFFSDYVSPSAQVAEWFGVRGIGSSHCSSGCATGFVTFDQAVNAVASGKYDFVLAGGVEMGNSLPYPDKPAHMRRQMTFQDLLVTVRQLYDRAYTRPMQAGRFQHDTPIGAYMHKYGIDAETVDLGLCSYAYHGRRASVLNECALNHVSYDELAEQNGYATAMEYLQSPCNPRSSTYVRASGMVDCCEGAAACVLCPTEIAREYSDKPIQVLGSGVSVYEAMNPGNALLASKEACRQVYEQTGVTPDELDLLSANDITAWNAVEGAEASGYLPEGEALQYFIDGRCAYDGDKPMNTSGGRSNFGQAHGASGLAEVFEVVTQMRGEAGAHQVKKPVQTAMIRGFGGAMNATATIFRTLD